MTMLCDWCQFCWLNGFKCQSKCLAKQGLDKGYNEKCRYFLPNYEVQNEVYTKKGYRAFARFYGKKVADYILSKVNEKRTL